MGYKVTPFEPLLNDLGYGFLQQKNYGKAYAFFKMNIDNHPKSWNTYDSMSDYYIAIGNKEKAIEYLTKALGLKDNPSTKERLDKLKNGK
ncbi:MAG TPA: tetratricopeptide repeat protein [Bacteroidia bacterium]|jgi:tetratricopeptide (TPR) repeat protein|nr:tetratricopeptide repeat protein [Bacteroidia bacterium]